MFGGKGYFRGSGILVSGAAGTGKTSVAAFFANETCKRKERCIYFAFEESPQQITRNMRSIGLDLNQWVKKGLLKCHAFRPGLYGLEMHLTTMYKLVKKFQPTTVILDPITNLVSIGLSSEVNSMLLRLIDLLQTEGITIMMTALNSQGFEHVDQVVSSLMDTWLLLKDIEANGERNRAMYIMKSRGMSHSNQVREFVINSKGLHLIDVFRGSEGVLVGSARIAKLKGMKNGRDNKTLVASKNGK